MKLKVNPNRMELLKLKRRLLLSEKGHRLLQDKLEKLISEFHRLIRLFKKTSYEWEDIFRQFLDEYLILKIQTSPSLLKTLLDNLIPHQIEINYQRLLNLRLLKISFKRQDLSPYSPKNIPYQWDKVYHIKKEVKEKLVQIVELYLAIEMVGKEILKTRRRVNALEYILIPQIADSIKFIESKLVEIEREFLSQLLRIKDVIRR